MIKKTLLMAAVLTAAAPVWAQSATTSSASKAAAARAASSSTSKLTSSDENFLSEMPLSDLPDADYLADTDGDGIVDGEDPDPKTPKTAGGSTVTPPTDKPEENVTYVYHPSSDTTLRRTIQDDRIQDGYVQGLMQQRGPQ